MVRRRRLRAGAAAGGGESARSLPERAEIPARDSPDAGKGCGEIPAKGSAGAVAIL